MKEYFIINNDYDKKEKTVISNNEDYKLSFLNRLEGGNKIEYIEIEEDVLKNIATEKQIEDIYTILNDKKLQALFPTRRGIRINKNGKLEISIKDINNIDIKKDIFI